ncbi:major latex protein 146-like [Argentina anserina]|uniref:major latex protein 146-like n=1 Tax=Argentina anserina TaxID=57926 RepID=UPI0021765DC3|nr:major latex protein 146-like [Potentilla anserina]
MGAASILHSKLPSSWPRLELDIQTQISTSADKFYGFFKGNMTSLVQIFPQHFKSFQILGGGEIRDACEIYWEHDLGSGLVRTKLKVQEIDDENRSISFNFMEGDIFKVYKSFKSKVQAISAGNGGCIVMWTLFFEKTNENAPDPIGYVELGDKVSRGLEAYLAGT